MAEQARKSNEEQRTQIEVTRMETNSAKASQMIANSNTTFDVNSVDTTTEETLRKIKKKNSEFNSQLEVANIVNKDKLRLSEAESAINKMNSDKAFDNL